MGRAFLLKPPWSVAVLVFKQTGSLQGSSQGGEYAFEKVLNYSIK